MLNNIRQLFENRSRGIIGEYEKSSVIIFLLNDSKSLDVIFEVRAFNLQHQPGDISLPGGRIDNGEGERDAAIREAMEELNINREDFDIIGEMDSLVTPYNRIIYPFVATLYKKEIHPNREEVNHIFRVPLKFFMENEPETYPIKVVSELPEDFPYHLIVKGKEYKFSSGNMKQYFYQYDGYVIWGITAQIIKAFVELIKGTNNKE